MAVLEHATAAGRGGVRSLLAAAFLFLGITSPSGTAHASCVAQDLRDQACFFVQAFGNEVSRVLRDRNIPPARKNEILYMFYVTRFDHNKIGGNISLATGVRWETIPPSARAEVSDLIGRYVVEYLVLQRLGGFLGNARIVSFKAIYSVYPRLGYARVRGAFIKDGEHLEVDLHLSYDGRGGYRIFELCLKITESCMLREYRRAMAQHSNSGEYDSLVEKLGGRIEALLETLRNLVAGVLVFKAT